jgi:hypothetical protein
LPSRLPTARLTLQGNCGPGYRAFEAAVVADYDARTAVERDLCLDFFPILYRAYSIWSGAGVELVWTVGRVCNSAVCPALSLFAVDPTKTRLRNLLRKLGHNERQRYALEVTVQGRHTSQRE